MASKNLTLMPAQCAHKLATYPELSLQFVVVLPSGMYILV